MSSNFHKKNELKNINKNIASNFHQNNKPKNMNKSALSNFHTVCLKNFHLDNTPKIYI